jgi:hypothetical protein
MPRVPDASSVTRLRAIQSSSVVDPVKRSASYTPAEPTLLYSLRASDAGRGMFPAQSYLSNPVACGWVNPRHQGFITRPSTTSVTFPVVQIPLPSGVDFSTEEYVDYDFELNLPPGPDFDAILVAGAEPPTNVQDIRRINISATDNAELFGTTTISTSPVWPGATYSGDATISRFGDVDGVFPGLSTILQFRTVPVIANIRIRIFGAD